MGKMKELAIVHQNDVRDMLTTVGKAFAILSTRERKILRLRYGMEDGIMRTLEYTGKLEGISRERIRQIEARAFEKIKLILEYEKKTNIGPL